MATAPLDVQAKLDEWLASNPAAQKYVTKLWYVPEGSETPDDVTHILGVTSALTAERSLRIGIVAKPEYAAFIDMLLAMLATQPPV